MWIATGNLPPNRVKALGRAGIRGFNNRQWDGVSEGFMRRIAWTKFSQNKPLREYLLSTGEAELIEANPYEGKWGAHMGTEDIKLGKQWVGGNLMGRILMDVREEMKPRPSPLQIDSAMEKMTI
jgi:ribA/ribD-fused uncharacterized protein